MKYSPALLKGTKMSALMKYLCAQYLAGNNKAIRLLDEGMNIAADLAYLEECNSTGMDPYTKGYGITHRFYDQDVELKDIQKSAQRFVQTIENQGAHTLSTYNDPKRNQLIKDMLELHLVNINGTGDDRVMWIFQKDQDNILDVQENAHENMGFEYHVKTCTIAWISNTGVSYGIEYNGDNIIRKNQMERANRPIDHNDTYAGVMLQAQYIQWQSDTGE